MNKNLTIHSWVGIFMNSRIGKWLRITSPIRLALFILVIHIIFIFSFGFYIQYFSSPDIYIVDGQYQINFLERVEFLMISISFFIYTPIVWWFYSSQLSFIPNIYFGLKNNHVINVPRNGYASLDSYIEQKLLKTLPNNRWKIIAIILAIIFFGFFLYSMLYKPLTLEPPVIKKWFVKNPVCYTIYGISTMTTIYLMIVATIRQISITHLIRSLNDEFKIVIQPLIDDIGGLAPFKGLISKLFLMATATGIWVNMVLLLKPISSLLYSSAKEENPYRNLWNDGWLTYGVNFFGMISLLLVFFLLGPYIIVSTIKSLRHLLLVAKQTELRLVSARFNSVFRGFQDYLMHDPLDDLKTSNDLLEELRNRWFLINEIFPSWPFTFRWIGGFSLITVLSFPPMIQSLIELVKLLIHTAPSG